MLRDRYLFASYCVCVKRITLCNCLCSSSSFSASIIWNIWEFRAKNYFTNHQTANTIHRLEIHFRSLKHTTVVRIRKNLETFHSYASDNKAIQFSNTSDCIFLLKFYDRSIIILLGNVLVNICSEISKI